MKLSQYYKSLLLFIGSLGVLPTCAYTQNGGDLRWDYSASHVQRNTNGSELDVAFTIKPVVKPKAQEVVYICPSYVSADGKKSIELERVCISGKKRYKVIRRRKALHNQKEDQLGSGEVYSIKKLKKVPLTVRKSFPFERWMGNGHIIVEEKSYGCAECRVSENSGIAIQVKIPVFGEEYYAYDFIKPDKVLVKCYEEAFDCKITFPVARHDLQKTFENNGKELARLEKFISESLTIKGAELKEVHIKGYASPEGEFYYNKSLAEKRTQILSDYIALKYPELKKALVYQATGIGEDWVGLENAVKSSSLFNKAEILSAIDRYQSDTGREAAIRNIDNGITYDKLLKDFYPHLRRTTFSLRFDVRPYTMEEIPEIFIIKPECLSQYEMYQLANLRDSQKENPIPVYQKAYQQFPSDTVAKLNYANALLKYEKDADGALRVLETVTNDARCLFPIAIAYGMKGDWEKAEEFLKEAADSSNVRAKEFYNMIISKETTNK